MWCYCTFWEHLTCIRIDDVCIFLFRSTQSMTRKTGITNLSWMSVWSVSMSRQYITTEYPAFCELYRAKRFVRNGYQRIQSYFVDLNVWLACISWQLQGSVRFKYTARPLKRSSWSSSVDDARINDSSEGFLSLVDDKVKSFPVHSRSTIVSPEVKGINTGTLFAHFSFHNNLSLTLVL